MTSPARENRVAAILWMLATMFCFISLDAMMKHLLETYPLIQVTWARFFFATLVALVLAGRRLPALLVSRLPAKQLGRSLLLMTTTGLFNAGIRTTPLAAATTIMFTSPLLVTALSVPLLKEAVGWRRWLGVAAGFLGAIIVVRPWQNDFGGLGYGVLFLLAAALFNANYQLLTRQVRVDDPLTSLLYTAAAGALFTSLIVPWVWVHPNPSAWVFFAGCGLAGGLGHFCLIRAMSLAPASVVAPFSYSSLMWSILFGLVFWGDLPDRATLAGAVLIVGSGLYVFSAAKREA
jgi:drug/metabolite transporter (DMT)-like permease